MGTVNVSGSLICGPSSGSESFPSSQFVAQLQLSSSPKGFQTASGMLTRTFTDANSYVAVGDVPRINFLYARSEGDFSLRLTQEDGDGGSIQRTLWIRGLCVLEFPDQMATLIEIASASRVEFFISGP